MVIGGIAAATALLVLPSLAGAVVYCVPNDSVDPSCTAGQGQATIDAALTAAETSTAVADTVHIDAGTYSEASLNYFTTTSTNLLTLEGEGVSQTLLTLPDTTGNKTGLAVTAPAGSVVMNLAMTIPANADGIGDRGIDLLGATVGQDLLVDGPSASNATGIRLFGTASLRDSTADLAFGSPSNIAVFNSQANSTIRDVILHANNGVVHGGNNATVTIDRASIEASFAGVSLDSGTAIVRNSLIDLGTNSGATGVRPVNGNNNVTPIEAIVDGVTIVGGGTNSTGIQVQADSDATIPINEPGDTTNDGETATATVANTVISGPAVSLKLQADRGEVATLTTSYSNYDATNKVVTSDLSPGGGTGTATLTEAHQTNLAPGFVGGGDFHLASTSPLIDIGDPAHPDPGALDFDGDPREIFGVDNCDGARRDIGFDEFLPLVPPTLLSCIPDTSILAGPDGPTSDATPEFQFESTELSSTFECSIDGGPYATCASPFTTSLLDDGPHTFAVKAIDADLNEDPSPATRSFLVDATPPQTSILSGPAGPTRDTTPTFEFDSSEQPASFRCSLDGAAFTACSSPVTTAGLADGPHTFAVKAADALLNEDASPAIRSFSVDATAPDTSVSGKAKVKTRKKKARVTFAFGATEGGSTFVCSLDGSPFAPCISPFSAKLRRGAHTLSVVATDATGNPDPTPASFTTRVKRKKTRR